MEFEFEYNKYFGTFEELKEALDQIEAIADKGRKNCMVVRAASYLLWSGIAKEQVTEVCYKHLGDTYIYDESCNCNRDLPESGMEFLREYARNRADFGPINLDDPIIRTVQKRHLSGVTLYGVFTRINSKIPDGQKQFIPIPIYESGVFHRVWEKQQNGLELPIYRRNRTLSEEGYALYEQVFERSFVSKNAITFFVKRYRAFVEHFYNEKPT